jgi:hypothetical protein
MMSKFKMHVIGVAILVTGVGIGVAGAQVAQALSQPSFLNTGLFSVRSGEQARFFVSLDDREDGQPARVALEFIDEDGRVVARKAMTLAAGQSATLAADRPGRYRAHARVLDEPRLLGARRTVVGTVEVENDNLVFPIRPVCAIDDSYNPVRPG